MSWQRPNYVRPKRIGGQLQLETALGRRGVSEGVLSRSAKSSSWALVQHDIEPLPLAFRQMVNERSFHVAEMALTTLAMAIEHGRPMIGIPVILNRDFHHRSIVVRAGSGIRDPRQLEGRRVGVRAYSQTTGVWVRGMLHDEFGVDPATVTWVVLEGSHVNEFSDPSNVELASPGESLQSLLASAAIDAAVIMNPQVDADLAVPLFPDAAEKAATGYAADGIFPVNHVVALDTDLVSDEPWIAQELHDGFLASKSAYAQALRTTGPRTAADRQALELGNIVGDDFNPYGLAANTKACQRLLTYAHRQGLISSTPELADLFLPVS